MKYVRKITLGCIFSPVILLCLWTLIAPMLFPGRVKAANDSYRKWIADNPSVKR